MEIKRLKDRFGKIGVLMGGLSTEREISLKSGSAIYEALKSAGLDVVAIDIKSDSVADNMDLLKSQKINCAFLALHGRFGEDGQIQAILDFLKMPYTCSGVKASQLAMDKIASRQIFKDNGLSVPDCQILEKNTNWSLEPDSLYPLVVKPATHGSSIGLSIARKEEELAEAVNFAFSFDKRVLIEQYIDGRELTVGVLDEEALPVVEIIPKNKLFDYAAKYQAGMTEYVVPADINKKVTLSVQNAGLKAHKLLGCYGCSRVDIILDKNNVPFVLEVNTIPGFTQTSLLPKAAKCSKIEFVDLCIKLIKLAYEKKQD